MALKCSFFFVISISGYQAMDLVFEITLKLNQIYANLYKLLNFSIECNSTALKIKKIN